MLATLVVVAALVGAERYMVDAHRSSDATDEPAPSVTPVAAAPQPSVPSAPAPTIVAADGSVLPPEKLRGRWTLVFTPDEPCVDTCARVMETLGAVARDPASGVPDGVAQIVVARPEGRRGANEIVVLDPEGHNAGLIAYMTDAGRIVSGLATLRAAFVANTTTASR